MDIGLCLPFVPNGSIFDTVTQTAPLFAVDFYRKREDTKKCACPRKPPCFLNC